MTLDYTSGSVNFRDAGEFVNLIAGKELMRKERLFRGGKTNFCSTAADIATPGTIINLRHGQDPQDFGARMIHCPASNAIEKYDTSDPEVRIWLNSVFENFEHHELPLPLFIHCLSGKDRTGIVIGIILMMVNIPREIILEEYLLSDGDVRGDLFNNAMNGVGDPTAYFSMLDVLKISENLKRWFLAGG
jgi:protein-tyrosine phosphatase